MGGGGLSGSFDRVLQRSFKDETRESAPGLMLPAWSLSAESAAKTKLIAGTPPADMLSWPCDYPLFLSKTDSES